MSLLRFVKLSPVGRSLDSAPLLVLRRRSSSVTAGKLTESAYEGLTEGDSLKSVEDLPALGNKWRMLWKTAFPTDNFHEQALEASLAVGNVWRIPLPSFIQQHLVVTSCPEYVREMFRNEGVIPFRAGGEHLEDFMTEKGFGKGIINT